MNFESAFTDICARIADLIGRTSGGKDDAVSAETVSDTEFNELALELFRLQFETNAPFRTLCEARAILPGKVDDWRQIPPMPAAAFKEREVTSLEPDQRTHVFHSSGTTDQAPSRHFHNDDSLDLYEASLKPWFVRNVLSAGSDGRSEVVRFGVLTPKQVEAPNSSLVHMFDVVSQELGDDNTAWLGGCDADGAWSVAVDMVVAFLEDSESGGRPVVLLGTAFLFVQLVDALDERGLSFRLPAGSQIMETGGYKGRSREMSKQELHRLIGQSLGVKLSDIVREYGMSELSSQAYATGDGPFRFPPWARAQIVSPESGQEAEKGETGLIRVFDLANVRSVAPLQTEDLGVRRNDGFELLGRAALAEPRGCSRMTI